MALGGSYASGTDSFAAAIANNTSSYGATAANSIAIGRQARASQAYAIAINNGASATASRAICIAEEGTASGAYSTVIGGYQPNDRGISGRFVIGSNTNFAQFSVFTLFRLTTDGTPTVLATNNSAPGTTNQVILPNNSTYTFRIQVVAMQQAAGGTDTAGYTFEGVIRRGANAAATVLKNSVKTVLQEDVAGWDCDVSADTTNGGLAVTVTGAASTNIRWVATVHTSEVTYA
jgi:hypothetical protein